MRLRTWSLPVEPDVLGLDRDAPLALEVHRVEVLGPHVAGVDGAGQLEDAVGERRLPVVDVGDDAEVADAVDRSMAEVDATARDARLHRVPAWDDRASLRSLSRLTRRGISVANIKSQIKRNRQNEKRPSATRPCAPS